MNQQDAIDAFDAALGSLLGIGDVLTEGIAYEPNQGVPYVRGRMAAYSSVSAGFGADSPINYSGTYQVNVNMPRRLGRRAAGQTAAVVAAAFPRGKALVTGTGKVLSVSNTNEMPAIDAGDWITVPVAIQWFATDP